MFRHHCYFIRDLFTLFFHVFKTKTKPVYISHLIWDISLQIPKKKIDNTVFMKNKTRLMPFLVLLTETKKQ